MGRGVGGRVGAAMGVGVGSGVGATVGIGVAVGAGVAAAVAAARVGAVGVDTPPADTALPHAVSATNEATAASRAMAEKCISVLSELLTARRASRRPRRCVQCPEVLRRPVSAVQSRGVLYGCFMFLIARAAA